MLNCFSDMSHFKIMMSNGVMQKVLKAAVSNWQVMGLKPAWTFYSLTLIRIFKQ